MRTSQTLLAIDLLREVTLQLRREQVGFLAGRLREGTEVVPREGTMAEDLGEDFDFDNNNVE